MKHTITILGAATLIAGVNPAVHVSPSPRLSLGDRLHYATRYPDTRQQDKSLPVFFLNWSQAVFPRTDKGLISTGGAKLETGILRAIETYNQALQLNANDASAYVGRGQARFAVETSRSDF